jgi:molybdopterin-guanine dinucleotide biosynthesis protein A
MKPFGHVAGFILAGGASSRMGLDKGLLDFGGAPLIVHTARLLEPLVAEVTIVGSRSRYERLGLNVIGDEAPADDKRIKRGPDKSCGPLAGIAAALSATHSRWNLIVACDMPYLSSEWIEWLLSRAMRSRGDAVIPRTQRGLEPLAAVYRRECGTQISAALTRGVRKVTAAAEQLRLDLVSPQEWAAIDSEGVVLRNMNAPLDYQDAVNWWAESRVSATHITAGRNPRKVQRATKRKPRSVPRRRK